MIKPFELIVLTPGKTIADVQEVTHVRAQLADGGGISIYPGHAPLLAETVSAPLIYIDPQGEHSLDLAAGILHIKSQTITIFTSGTTEQAEDDRQGVSEEDMRFDRLAKELLMTLQHTPT